MVTVVSRTQMQVGHVCVDLRGRDVAVAQQSLNGTRIGSMLQKMSRETVAQGVWRNALNTSLFSMSFDDEPGKLPCDRSSAMQKDIGQR